MGNVRWSAFGAWPTLRNKSKDIPIILYFSKSVSFQSSNIMEVALFRLQANQICFSNQILKTDWRTVFCKWSAGICLSRHHQPIYRDGCASRVSPIKLLGPVASIVWREPAAKCLFWWGPVMSQWQTAGSMKAGPYSLCKNIVTKEITLWLSWLV